MLDCYDLLCVRVLCAHAHLYDRFIHFMHSIERLKKENSSFKRDARDWEMEAKKLRKQNENLEFKVECLETSCEPIIFIRTSM